MRGKTALIGFLVLQVAVLLIWAGSLIPVMGAGVPFISPDVHIWSGGVYGVETSNFRMRTSGLSAAPFKVYGDLLWATGLVVASAAAAWFAGGAFRRARPWLSAGLAILTIGLATGAAYWIVEQWSGDTMFQAGSVNDQFLYMATRSFLMQAFLGYALLAIYAVLTIAGLATADKPLGFHLVVLNWMIVAIVWVVLYAALFWAPTLLKLA